MGKTAKELYTEAWRDLRCAGGYYVDENDAKAVDSFWDKWSGFEVIADAVCASFEGAKRYRCMRGWTNYDLDYRFRARRADLLRQGKRGRA